MSERDQPFFSFVIPVYRPAPGALRRCLESCLGQTRAGFEVCLCLDGPQPAGIETGLRRRASSDPRLRLASTAARGGISSASNEAARLARGDWLVFVDQDDLVSAELLERMRPFTEGADLLYTDQDKLLGPLRILPFVKPGPSLHNLMACNYYSHCRAFRRDAFERVGGYDSAFDGSQDYDLTLRLLGEGARAARVPGLLYHWRMSLASTSLRPASKPRCLDAAVRALARAFPDRDFVPAPRQPGFYRWTLRRPPEPSAFFLLTRAGLRRGDGAAGRPGEGENPFVLCAPWLDPELLRGGGFLSVAPGVFDPLARTISFRLTAGGRLLAGGVNGADGEVWYAATRRYMGLRRVTWECVLPNPHLFAARWEAVRALGLHDAPPPTAGALLARAARTLSGGIHLDAPIGLEIPRGAAVKMSLPARWSGPGFPGRHEDHLRFMRTAR